MKIDIHCHVVGNGTNIQAADTDVYFYAEHLERRITKPEFAQALTHHMKTLPPCAHSRKNLSNSSCNRPTHSIRFNPSRRKPINLSSK